jgi:hypothetical protein
MNLTAIPLSLASLGLARPTPCCAVITPTRSSDIWSQLRRLADRLSEAWWTQMPHRQKAEDAMPVDAATLRDLGVNHASTLRERVDPFAERRHPRYLS